MINSEVASLINKGFIYVGGRDKHFRPYIVIKPSVVLDTTPNEMTIIAAVLMNFQFVFNKMFQQGSIENVVIIADIDGVSMWNFSVSLFKSIAKIVGAMLAGRTRQFYCLNSGTIFSVILKAASFFMDANSINKLQVTSDGTHEKL